MTFISTDPVAVNPADPLIGVRTVYVAADQITTPPPTPSTLPWTENDVRMLATAMHTQGTFFFGQYCRSPEAATKLARDLLWLLYVMKYEKPAVRSDGPLAPPPGPPS